MSTTKLYIASVIGEILEWYDFSLYGFLGPVFAILFFPQHSALTGVIGVFTIFAIGFLSRPFGGLLFGWLADRKGRKAAFFISLMSMAAATFLMGCLPTYQTIGFMAPFFLLILRLLQGFSCGGEFSVSMIFLSEHASKKNYFFSGSLAWMGMMIGALIASLFIMLLSHNHDFFMRWGWRLPFLVGGMIALIGMYLRLNVAETPVFLALKKSERIENNSWGFVKKYKKNMLAIFLLNTPLAAISYVGVAFLPTFFAKFVKLSFEQGFLINTILILSLIILIPVYGRLADKWQGTKIYYLSLISLITLSIPAYYLFAYGHSWFAYGLAILLLAMSSAMIKAVAPGLSVALAPLEDRAVVMSVAYNITYSLIGGTAPLLMSYLLGATQMLLWPALYVMFFSIIALFFATSMFQ